MSDGQQPPGGEPVGSVGEEAAKLFGALSAWAQEQSREQSREQARDGARGGAGGQAGEPGRGQQAAASAREALAQGLHDVGEHLGSTGPDCRWCPVCQVIHVVRQTSPEVRAHLASAAGSLMQAAAGLMATTPPPSGRGPVEHIDLDDDIEPWDAHQQEDDGR
ncbi:hypothetical protein [Nocardioides marmoraquaticus]